MTHTTDGTGLSRPARGLADLAFDTTTRPALLLGMVVAILSLLYAIFIAPMQSYSAIYTNDTLVFFDGIHLIENGRLPSRDFSTPLGALGYLIPWAGQQITGGFGGAMEMAGFLAALMILPVTALFLATRTGPLVSGAVLAILAMVLIVPVNLGEVGLRVSAAMFYNRWSWAALATLFLTGLRSTRNPGWLQVLEAVAIGYLLVFLFLLKVSYAAVAVAYLLTFSVLFPRLRLRAPLVVATVALLLGALQLWTGLLSAYLADVHSAIISSGAVRSDLTETIIATLRETLPVAICFGLALRWRVVTWQETVFAAFVILSGIALVNQNAQFLFIATLIVPWALLAARLGEARAAPLRVLTPVLALVFLVPQLTHWAVAMNEFRFGTRYAQARADLPGLDGFYVGESWIDGFAPMDDAGRLDAADMLAARKVQPAQVLGQAEYVRTLRAGLALLERNEVAGQTVLALDFLNPFPAMLDLPRVVGGYSWLHDGRNIDEDTRPPAEEFFAGQDWVIVPRYSVWPPSAEFLWQEYGAWLETQYSLVDANPFWRLYRRG